MLNSLCLYSLADDNVTSANLYSIYSFMFNQKQIHTFSGYEGHKIMIKGAQKYLS